MNIETACTKEESSMQLAQQAVLGARLATYKEWPHVHPSGTTSADKVVWQPGKAVTVTSDNNG